MGAHLDLDRGPSRYRLVDPGEPGHRDPVHQQLVEGSDGDRRAGERVVEADIDGHSSVAGQCTIEFIANEPGGPNATILGAVTETIQSGPFHIKVAMPSDAS